MGGETFYDVLFDYDIIPDSTEGIRTVWYSQKKQFESLQIHIYQFKDDNNIEVFYDYQTEFFSEDQINEIHKSLINALQGRQTKNKILAGPVVPIPEASIYELFEKQVATSKGNISFNNQVYSFSDLQHDAEKIDAAIRGHKRIIGILCERSYLELAAVVVGKFTVIKHLYFSSF